jgi:hypothetical protein
MLEVFAHTIDAIPLVVDTSVVLKWQLEDEAGAPQTLAFRDDLLFHSRIDLQAPSLLFYEVTNAILTAARRGRLSLLSTPRRARRDGGVCPRVSPLALRRLGLPPLALGLPPAPAGVLVVRGHKALPSVPGFGYNPHSL